MAILGAKGGKAGTGAMKIRGDSEYYRQLAKRRLSPEGKKNQRVREKRKIKL